MKKEVADPIDPEVVELYTILVKPDGVTWARMWMPSPSDFRRMRGVTADVTEDEIEDSVQTLYANIAAACVEFVGPRPGTIDDQPVEWLTKVLDGWLNMKAGGLDPEPATS